MAGLCPGTSCVAAASGRIDGVVVVIGMFAGVLGIGLLLGRLQSFYESTPRGSLTFPDLLNLSTGLIVFFVTVVAIVGFIIADRIEQRSSRASAS
jgi:uncharacterized membrane protein YedE/YeeE